MKGASEVALTNAKVWIDKIGFNLEPPATVMDSVFADRGGAHNTLFRGAGYAAGDL